MKVDKKVISVISIYAIITAIFAVCTLAIPFEKSPASWVAFAFALVSLVGGCGITLYAFGKAPTLKSKFYGYPLFKVGALYTIIQLIVTLPIYIVGAFVEVPYWVGLALSILVTGLAAIGVIAVDSARDYVETVDAKTLSSTKTMSKFTIDIADVLDMCKDETIYAPLKKLVDKFKYSDIVSTPETATIESQIKREVEELKKMIAIESADVVIAKIDEISNLLSSRNRQCENSKRN